MKVAIPLGLAIGLTALSTAAVIAQNRNPQPGAYPTFPAHTGTPIKANVSVSPYAVPADSIPAGVWQSEAQKVPQAGCHPHCHLPPPYDSGFGDPVGFSFSPHETPPKDYIYRYANPRFVSQWGNGCPFEVWNPFQSTEGGATLNAWARSEPCYFTVALDRFAVHIEPPH